MNILNIIIAVILAPFFLGLVNQTKAFFAGKKGPGVLRLYSDIFKLLKKSRPFPQHSTWIFQIAQPVTLASTLTAAIIFPWSGSGSGTLALSTCAAIFFYILATGRIFTILASLDAGSAFEGMGSSREAQFATFLEPIIFIILGFLVLLTGQHSLAGMLLGTPNASWLNNVVPIVLIVLTFFVILLCENCRVPFDDPETHLELTMIHEAMLLDVGGPDLAFALYSAALKFELTAAFLVMILLPPFSSPIIQLTAILGGITIVSLAVGIIESTMARMRFLKSPLALIGVILIAILAIFLTIYT